MLLRHYRRISRALAALCIASLLLAGGPHRIPAAPAPGELHALSAVLMDGDSGRGRYPARAYGKEQGSYAKRRESAQNAWVMAKKHGRLPFGCPCGIICAKAPRLCVRIQ